MHRKATVQLCCDMIITGERLAACAQVSHPSTHMAARLSTEQLPTPVLRTPPPCAACVSGPATCECIRQLGRWHLTDLSGRLPLSGKSRGVWRGRFLAGDGLNTKSPSALLGRQAQGVACAEDSHHQHTQSTKSSHRQMPKRTAPVGAMRLLLCGRYTHTVCAD